ncbi:MAG: hypothetical protein OEQ18_13725 [Gammaproteobacteria bacterium]|nr:hypothetical protein [Gammaproteobacteria bacterium]
MGKKSKSIQGEGDYRAARRYNEKAEEFAESGRVEQAARRAGNVSERQKHEMEEAEKEGKSRAKVKGPTQRNP